MHINRDKLLVSYISTNYYAVWIQIASLNYYKYVLIYVCHNIHYIAYRINSDTLMFGIYLNYLCMDSNEIRAS